MSRYCKDVDTKWRLYSVKANPLQALLHVSNGP